MADSHQTGLLVAVLGEIGAARPVGAVEDAARGQHRAGARPRRRPLGTRRRRATGEQGTAPAARGAVALLAANGWFAVTAGPDDTVPAGLAAARPDRAASARVRAVVGAGLVNRLHLPRVRPGRAGRPGRGVHLLHAAQLERRSPSTPASSSCRSSGSAPVTAAVGLALRTLGAPARRRPPRRRRSSGCAVPAPPTWAADAARRRLAAHAGRRVRRGALGPRRRRTPGGTVARARAAGRRRLPGADARRSAPSSCCSSTCSRARCAGCRRPGCRCSRRSPCRSASWAGSRGSPSPSPPSASRCCSPPTRPRGSAGGVTRSAPSSREDSHRQPAAPGPAGHAVAVGQQVRRRRRRARRARTPVLLPQGLDLFDGNGPGDGTGEGDEVTLSNPMVDIQRRPVARRGRARS